MPKSRRRAVARKKSSTIVSKKRATIAQDQLAAISQAGFKRATVILDTVVQFENDLAQDLERVALRLGKFYDARRSALRSVFTPAPPRRKKVHKSAINLTAVVPHSPKLGLVFLIFGGVLLLFPTAFKHYQEISMPKFALPTIRIALPQSKPTSLVKALEPIKIDSQLLAPKEPSQAPQRIVVPSLNVDLPIIEANVVNGYWQLSDTTASHGVGSANPGELGNVVIFAHARDDLFGPLRKAQKATIIYVLTKDHWYKYQVQDIKLVDPTDVQVIAPTKDEELTLYTCDGFLDSKRLIISAAPLR